MNNPTLHKSLYAEGGIKKSRIVLQTGDDQGIQAGADNATHIPFGVSDPAADVDAGKVVDTITHGIAPIEYGDDIDPGSPLTSDAEGRAIKAEPAPGEQVACVGFSTVSGEEDVIGAVRISPFILTGV